MFLQLQVPEDLSRKLTILKGQLGLRTKQEVLLYLLDKYVFKEKEGDDKNG